MVAERAIGISEALMDERDPREVADLTRPLKGLLVIGGRGLRLPQVLRAAAHSDEHAEPQELIGRLRCLDPAKERLQRLARPARIPRDPGGHGELIVGRAAERLVA